MAVHTRRVVGVLTMVAIPWTVRFELASAAPMNSTVLVSRPTGLTLPAPGDNDSGTSTGQRAISGDGRFVVFTSDADDLGVRDTLTHVWLRDALADTTTLVDRVPGDGTAGNGGAGSPAISRDGSTVCFESEATNLVAGVTGHHVFVVTLATGAIVAADRAAGAAGAPGNGRSERCGLDATGMRVVFESEAADLVPADGNDSSDVFLRDLGGNSTTRVSVDAMGAEAASGGRHGVISADGLKIAFEADDALASGDTNGDTDVYVRNTQAGTLVRASVATGGVQANGPSFDASIDDAGAHVAFASEATNLDVGGDANDHRDIFWRDLGADTTVLVSRATGAGGALGDADSDTPAISGDGLGVAFGSGATNLGAGAPPAGARWVYLRRLGTNETSLLSRASGATGSPADAFAGSVSLGTAPTVAAFTSNASNLAPDASGAFAEVFKRDLSGTPATTLVSRPSGTAPRSSVVSDSSLPGPQAMSADGRLVLFASRATGLDPAAVRRLIRLFVRDTVASTTTLVSRGPGPAGEVPNDDVSFGGAAIGAGGTHVAFLTAATNLLEDTNGLQVYVRDLASGGLEVASRADGPTGVLSLAVVDSGVSITANGRRVAFTADDPLVPADTNLRSDVYVRDLDAGTTTLLSVAASGGAGDQNSTSPSLSDDGRRVAFVSRATNLLAGGPISGEHLYVRDLVDLTTVLADRRADDGTPGTGGVQGPMISGAGNRVAFFTMQPLTSEALPPSSGAIYVRDLLAGTTLLASRADGADGVAATASFRSALNHDGTRVEWTGSGDELPGGADAFQVYLRDFTANTTRLVSAVDGTAATPANARSFGAALDAGGGCVVFTSLADNLVMPGYPTQDFSQVYLRAVDGECLASVTTSTTLPPGSGTPIPANAVVVKPGRLVKLVAKGLSGLPIASADPTTGGGTLAIGGTTGSASFPLAASGWKAVGRGEPKGFKFKGGGCRATLLRRKIKAACHGDTGGLALPEPGPLGVVLVVDDVAYCAECGGTPAGRGTRVFKRRACPAPATCP